MAVKAKTTVTLVRVNDGKDGTIMSPTEPSDKTKAWLDTSESPSVLKRWSGSKWEIVNEVQVGGRNLLRNTKLLERPVYIYDSTNTAEYFLDPISDIDTGFSYAELSATTLGTNTFVKWITWGEAPILKKELINKDTVLSFEYQFTKQYETTDSPLLVEYYITNQKGASRVYYMLSYHKVNEAAEWQRFEFKRIITDEMFKHIQGGTTTTITKDECLYFVVRIYSNKNYNAKFRKFKFETGNKGTDWSQAQEDIDTELGALYDDTNTLGKDIQDTKTEIQVLSDSILNMVTVGDNQTIFEQTENGWQFNINKFLKPINDELNSIDKINGRLDGLDKEGSELSENLESLKQKVNGLDNSSYINIGTDENGAPCILLGSTKSDFKVRITNTSIDFLDDKNKLAYFDKNSLYIPNDLTIGIKENWKWSERTNGNLGLRWEG